jgi:hypothetical protein
MMRRNSIESEIAARGPFASVFEPNATVAKPPGVESGPTVGMTALNGRRLAQLTQKRNVLDAK